MPTFDGYRTTTAYDELLISVTGCKDMMKHVRRKAGGTYVEVKQKAVVEGNKYGGNSRGGKDEVTRDSPIWCSH